MSQPTVKLLLVRKEGQGARRPEQPGPQDILQDISTGYSYLIVRGSLQGGYGRGQGDRELRPYQISTGQRGGGLVAGV